MRLGITALIGLCCLTGCRARRILQISSSPPGALVRLDEKILGRTPLEHEFLHYGTRRLNFYLDGYRTHSERLKLRPPWYSAFPIDLITEVLLPIGWVDRRRIRVKLIPAVEGMKQPDVDAVLERAEAFRRATPGGPRPSVERPPPAAPETRDQSDDPDHGS